MKEKIKQTNTMDTGLFGAFFFFTGGIASILWFLRMANEFQTYDILPIQKKLFYSTSAAMALVLIIAILLFILPYQDLLTGLLLLLYNVACLLVFIFYLASLFTFRATWNKLEDLSTSPNLKCNFVWTLLLGPVYLNFKINQLKGTEL